MTAAHPAARVRLDLRLRAAELTCALHASRIWSVVSASDTLAALRTARAAAAHVARLAVLHRGAGLWSELVAVAQRPTCAVCDAPVEHASVARDVARCSTIVAVRCHGETETMTIADWLLEDHDHRDLVAFRGAARRAVNGS